MTTEIKCDSHGKVDCEVCEEIEMTQPIPDNEICHCVDCEPFNSKTKKVVRKEWYDEKLGWVGSTDDGNECITELL